MQVYIILYLSHVLLMHACNNVIIFIVSQHYMELHLYWCYVRCHCFQPSSNSTSNSSLAACLLQYLWTAVHLDGGSNQTFSDSRHGCTDLRFQSVKKDDTCAQSQAHTKWQSSPDPMSALRVQFVHAHMQMWRRLHKFSTQEWTAVSKQLCIIYSCRLILWYQINKMQ